LKVEVLLAGQKEELVQVQSPRRNQVLKGVLNEAMKVQYLLASQSSQVFNIQVELQQSDSFIVAGQLKSQVNLMPG